MTPERLAYFRDRMVNHDVENDTAIVKLTARELQELLTGIAGSRGLPDAEGWWAREDSSGRTEWFLVEEIDEEGDKAFAVYFDEFHDYVSVHKMTGGLTSWFGPVYLSWENLPTTEIPPAPKSQAELDARTCVNCNAVFGDVFNTACLDPSGANRYQDHQWEEDGT